MEVRRVVRKKSTSRRQNFWGIAYVFYYAMILVRTSEIAMKNGKYIEEGSVCWYYKDQLHNENGPAMIEADGSKHWFLNGVLHRIGEPAIEWATGGKEWWYQGMKHREDGPAVASSNGTEMWFLNGKLHRIDGPAVTVHDGATAWYKDGLLHRLDGPAAEGSDGTREWHVEGKQFSEDDFIKTFTPTKPIENSILKLRKKFTGLNSSGGLKRK